MKLIKDKSRKSKVIEEINSDITGYGKKYNRQLFIVYDLGVIRDELEFRRDIENAGDSIRVVIIKQWGKLCPTLILKKNASNKISKNI